MRLERYETTFLHLLLDLKEGSQKLAIFNFQSQFFGQKATWLYLKRFLSYNIKLDKQL